MIIIVITIISSTSSSSNSSSSSSIIIISSSSSIIIVTIVMFVTMAARPLADVPLEGAGEAAVDVDAAHLRESHRKSSFRVELLAG